MAESLPHALAVEISALGFTYRSASRPALRGVDFHQRPGELVGIMGATGAGKSTFCRCLNGLIPNFVRGQLKGKVRVLGQDLATQRVADVARNVGIVFQEFEPQLFSTSVALEVAFGPENLGVPRAELLSRVASALVTVGLDGFEDADPATLSGGEKQRLAIAAVLAMHPAVLVMDEPTTDLDPLGKRAVFDLTLHLKKDLAACLLAEHETEFMLEADRIVILNKGEIALEGAPGQIFRGGRELETLGVRPLETVQLAELLDIEDRCLTVGDMTSLLRQKRYRFDAQRFEQLQAQDHAAPRSCGEPVIEVRELCFAYQAHHNVLEHLSLTINRGEFVALLGQNGSGKTTLVKHFNGLLQPSSGSVQVCGRDTRSWKMSDLGKTVGYVFQNPDHQLFAETVEEEVAFGPRNYGLSQEEVSRNVAHALSVTALTGREQDDPFSLPKGERQRLAVASVLASEPQIIVLDEPTTGLDYRDQCAAMRLVQQLNAKGHTIIVVTHAMWLAAHYAHRCIIMRSGTIIADGPTREVFSQEESLGTASLVAPAIAQLGKSLGGTTLSARELAYCLVQDHG